MPAPAVVQRHETFAIVDASGQSVSEFTASYAFLDGVDSQSIPISFFRQSQQGCEAATMTYQVSPSLAEPRSQGNDPTIVKSAEGYQSFFSGGDYQAAFLPTIWHQSSECQSRRAEKVLIAEQRKLEKSAAEEADKSLGGRGFVYYPGPLTDLLPMPLYAGSEHVYVAFFAPDRATAFSPIGSLSKLSQFVGIALKKPDVTELAAGIPSADSDFAYRYSEVPTLIAGVVHVTPEDLALRPRQEKLRVGLRSWFNKQAKVRGAALSERARDDDPNFGKDATAGYVKQLASEIMGAP
jgi:hypothetical protein